MIEANSLDQVRGKNIFPLIAKEYRKAYKALTQDVFQGKSGTLEFKMIGLKGRPLWLFTHAVPLYDEKGEVVSSLWTTIDITERQRLEEQLRQSQKLESVGRLAGGVAHDFNNYLTSIQGYIDLVLMALPDDSPIRQELLESRTSCERAADVTRQLLLFSRRETTHLKPANLNTVIVKLLKMLRSLIGERYSLVTHLDDHPWRISADTPQIEQVIMNLTVNARDAMPEGGEITISTTNFSIDEEFASADPGSRPGEFVRLSIRDTGTGMDTETLSHIFEPFFSTKGASRGTGLGLSVVYGIVSQHEGWIEVKSTPGSGTTCDVFLPAVLSGESIDETETLARENLQGQGEKILLVEDDDAVRSLAGKMLDQNCYTVVAAASAEEALRIFEESGGDFHLVFSDVILPRESGVELVDRLLEQKPGLKVLLASGYSDVTWQKEIGERGYAFLQKPYSLQCVLRTLSELLREG